MIQPIHVGHNIEFRKDVGIFSSIMTHRTQIRKFIYTGYTVRSITSKLLNFLPKL